MFPRIFIIAHFFDLSRLLHKKQNAERVLIQYPVTKEADDGNQNRNVRQKKSEAASGTTAHSLPPSGGEGSDSISGQKIERAPVWGGAFSLEQMTGNFAFLQISNILCINADFRHYILNICAITGLLCHILWVRFG